jgi:signal transduction histidine kinase
VGDELEFSVADRGPGIDPAERERIFEPFFRSKDAMPDRGRAGLGLSIGRHLATAQGGTLTYLPREGGGSRFVLRLPAVDATLVDS